MKAKITTAPNIKQAQFIDLYVTLSIVHKKGRENNSRRRWMWCSRKVQKQCQQTQPAECDEIDREAPFAQIKARSGELLASESFTNESGDAEYVAYDQRDVANG